MREVVVRVLDFFSHLVRWFIYFTLNSWFQFQGISSIYFLPALGKYCVIIIIFFARLSVNKQATFLFKRARRGPQVAHKNLYIYDEYDEVILRVEILIVT